jgi:uncharacterized membrane protein YuzA (DUF378 family)
MNKLKGLDWLFLILLIIGGLNWGLVGLFKFDLVAAIFGQMAAVTRVVYTIVGLSALYTLIISGKLAKK